MRRRRLERDRDVRRLRRRPGRAAGRRRGGGRGEPRHGPAGRPPRRALVGARRRGRPDHRRALDLGGPRLPGRRPGARVRCATAAGPSTSARPTRRRSRRSARLTRTRGSSPRSSRRTRSRAGDVDAEVDLVCLSGRGDKDLAEVLAHTMHRFEPTPSTRRSAPTSRCCGSPTANGLDHGASTPAAATATCEASPTAATRRPGPFFVEGAEPGDTLAVRFDRIWPNRDAAGPAARRATSSTPSTCASCRPRAERAAVWHVDLEPARRRSSRAARRPRVAGDAAARARCSAASASRRTRGRRSRPPPRRQHGGNMDYRGFAPGVTVYFPVFVAGALFHLGDGHALQGDGEIVGTGIEISFDVEFTVARASRESDPLAARRERRRVSSPSATPVPSTRRSSTRRRRCCAGSQQDYGLDSRAAAHLLGQASATTSATSSTPPTRSVARSRNGCWRELFRFLRRRGCAAAARVPGRVARRTGIVLRAPEHG